MASVCGDTLPPHLLPRPPPPPPKRGISISPSPCPWGVSRRITACHRVSRRITAKDCSQKVAVPLLATTLVRPGSIGNGRDEQRGPETTWVQPNAAHSHGNRLCLKRLDRLFSPQFFP